jgi:hypothetical protein
MFFNNGVFLGWFLGVGHWVYANRETVFLFHHATYWNSQAPILCVLTYVIWVLWLATLSLQLALMPLCGLSSKSKPACSRSAGWPFNGAHMVRLAPGERVSTLVKTNCQRPHTSLSLLFMLKKSLSLLLLIDFAASIRSGLEHVLWKTCY